MTTHKRTIIVLSTFAIFAILAYIYLLPIAHKIRSDIKVRATFVAGRNDYKTLTTPLSAGVVEDICVSLNIKASSENCQKDILVYAPDFFDEIKKHFDAIPRKNRTYSSVQETLGEYVMYCEKPDPDGFYICAYDLRGDMLYPVYFYFDKDGFYFRVIANWDRSDF